MVDKNLENNPKYPMNNPDPARIAYHYKANIINRKEWDAKVLKVKQLIQQTNDAVKELEEFTFAIGVEHEHTSDQ